MKQIDILVDIIKQQPNQIIDYPTLYEEYAKICGCDLTDGQKGGIRKNIQLHSSDCATYDAKNEDLFYSVEGLGKGIWGLRKHIYVKKYNVTSEEMTNGDIKTEVTNGNN